MTAALTPIAADIPETDATPDLGFGVTRSLAERLGCRLGDGVTLIHFDEGWQLDHPAFDRYRAAGHAPSFIGRGNVASGRYDHGTSVLGMHMGARAGEPLLPGARFVLAQAIAAEDLPPDAFLKQALAETEGARARVLLIARDWSSRAPHIPLELRQGMRDLIASATRLGVVVVAAAGNGGVDLEQLVIRDGTATAGQVTFAGDPWLAVADQISPALSEDSGAIIVGAATASAPYRRWTAGFPNNPQPRSNYGHRVDCWAPGEQVSTASIDRAGRPGWTSQFGGTSAASATITAMVAALQSLVIAASGRTTALSPAMIRKLFRDPQLGRPVWDGQARIGSVPQLPAIIARVLGTAPQHRG